MCSSQAPTYLKFTAHNDDRVLGAYRLPADWRDNSMLDHMMARERITLEQLNQQVQLRPSTEEEWREHVNLVTQSVIDSHTVK